MVRYVIGRLTNTILPAVIIFCAGACNSSDPRGSVIGKVTYNGESIDGGELNIISKAGVAATSKIDAAGAYRIEGALKPGEYSVYVNPPMPPQLPPGTPIPPAPEFKVPARFRDPRLSGVTITIKPGKNDIPVQFQD